MPLTSKKPHKSKWNPHAFAWFHMRSARSHYTWIKEIMWIFLLFWVDFHSKYRELSFIRLINLIGAKELTTTYRQIQLRLLVPPGILTDRNSPECKSRILTQWSCTVLSALKIISASTLQAEVLKSSKCLLFDLLVVGLSVNCLKSVFIRKDLTIHLQGAMHLNSINKWNGLFCNQQFAPVGFSTFRIQAIHIQAIG